MNCWLISIVNRDWQRILFDSIGWQSMEREEGEKRREERHSFLFLSKAYRGNVCLFHQVFFQSVYHFDLVWRREFPGRFPSCWMIIIYFNVLLQLLTPPWLLLLLQQICTIVFIQQQQQTLIRWISMLVQVQRLLIRVLLSHHDSFRNETRTIGSKHWS